MSVLKTVITIILVIVSIILSIVVLMQEGKQEGLGSLAGGASTDTYWSKNKGRSKEGALKKFTTALYKGQKYVDTHTDKEVAEDAAFDDAFEIDEIDDAE